MRHNSLNELCYSDSNPLAFMMAAFTLPVGQQTMVLEATTSTLRFLSHVSTHFPAHCNHYSIILSPSEIAQPSYTRPPSLFISLCTLEAKEKLIGNHLRALAAGQKRDHCASKLRSLGLPTARNIATTQKRHHCRLMDQKIRHGDALGPNEENKYMHNSHILTPC